MTNLPELKTLGLIKIPEPIDYKAYERNQNLAYKKGFEACPCCGRAIKNPQYFFHSAFGGMAYIPSTGLGEEHDNQYPDTWIMGVGTECRKRFPEGYIFKLQNT